jgi:branched-subunit amino acid transport protein
MEREAMSGIWVVMIAVGLLTFATRLSFVLLLERWQPPEIIRCGLRYVPVAVLTAIFIPEMLITNGNISLTLLNQRLIAGLVAILVAWRTKSALWTIALGMLVYTLINLL